MPAPTSPRLAKTLGSSVVGWLTTLTMTTEGFRCPAALLKAPARQACYARLGEGLSPGPGNSPGVPKDQARPAHLSASQAASGPGPALGREVSPRCCSCGNAGRSASSQPQLFTCEMGITVPPQTARLQHPVHRTSPAPSPQPGPGEAGWTKSTEAPAPGGCHVPGSHNINSVTNTSVTKCGAKPPQVGMETQSYFFFLHCPVNLIQ